MAETRYFFSPDGTESLGPVTLSALHQLVNDRVLVEGSFLCPEGSTEWQEIDLDFFAPPAEAAPEPEPDVSELATEEQVETEPAPPTAEMETPQPAQHRAVIPKRRSKTSRRLPQPEEPDLFAHFASAVVEPESALVVTPEAESVPEPESLLAPPEPETPAITMEPLPPQTPQAAVPPQSTAPEPEAPIITVPHYYAPPVRRPAAASSPAAKRVEAEPVPETEQKPAPKAASPTRRRRSPILAWSMGILLGLACFGGVWKFESARRASPAAQNPPIPEEKLSPHPDSYPGLLRPPAK